MDRFYFYVTTASLAVDDLLTSKNIKIFSLPDNNICILEIEYGMPVKVRMYNTLGEELLRTLLKDMEVNDVLVTNIISCYYIVKVILVKEIITKKIIK